MKIKNKKLFALLMLPAVIVMMVLPLCSFTTVNRNDDSTSFVYKPKLFTNVGYLYHRTTSTIDTYYYSEIPNINQTIVGLSENYDGDYFVDLSSIQMYASDYVIAGNTSINYKGRSASLNPSVYYSTSDINVLGADVSLYSEDAVVAYFSGDFKFSGLILPYDDDKNGLSDTAVKLLGQDQSAFSLNDLSCTIDFKYVNFSSNNYLIYKDAYLGENSLGETNISLADISELSSSDFISFNTILKYALENFSFVDNSGRTIQLEYEYISDIHFKFRSISDNSNHDTIGGIVLRDILYNSDYSSSYITSLENYIAQKVYDLGLDSGFDNGYQGGLQQGYDIGYDTGYNYGLSSAPSVWGSLSTFLTKTVGSFLNTPLFPGFNFSVLATVFVGAMLLIAFLKLFAGG